MEKNTNPSVNVKLSQARPLLSTSGFVFFHTDAKNSQYPYPVNNDYTRKLYPSKLLELTRTLRH